MDEQQQQLSEECQNCLAREKKKKTNRIITELDNKPIQKELENLYEEFGLLYRVYKPVGDQSSLDGTPYWPFICERCGVPLKEDLNDPGYRSYAWRFARYCINGNLKT